MEADARGGLSSRGRRSEPYDVIMRDVWRIRSQLGGCHIHNGNPSQKTGHLISLWALIGGRPVVTAMHRDRDGEHRDPTSKNAGRGSIILPRAGIILVKTSIYVYSHRAWAPQCLKTRVPPTKEAAWDSVRQNDSLKLLHEPSCHALLDCSPSRREGCVAPGGEAEAEKSRRSLLVRLSRLQGSQNRSIVDTFSAASHKHKAAGACPAERPGVPR